MRAFIPDLCNVQSLPKVSSLAPNCALDFQCLKKFRCGDAVREGQTLLLPPDSAVDDRQNEDGRPEEGQSKLRRPRPE